MTSGNAAPYRTWNPVEREWVLTVPSRGPLTAQADLSGGQPRECAFCDVFAPGEADGIHVVPSKHPMVPPVLGFEDERISQHAVLVYSKYHDTRLAKLPVARCRDLFAQIALRCDQLMANENIRSICVTEAVGDHWGVTVAHPHAQIISVDFEIRVMSLDDAEGCRLCTRSNDSHLVKKLRSAVAVVPPWARFPFETVIYSQRHVPSLSAMSDDELSDAAQLTHEVLNAYYAQTDGAPQYLLGIMQAPRGRRSEHHLRIELVPLQKPDGTLKRPGIMETMFGLYINPTAATEAAATLRALLAQG